MHNKVNRNWNNQFSCPLVTVVSDAIAIRIDVRPVASNCSKILHSTRTRLSYAAPVAVICDEIFISNNNIS